MSVIVEGQRSVWMGAQAWLLSEDRELAWAAPHIVANPAYKWILGRYVEAGRPNENGQAFALDDLVVAQASLVHAPLNMVHQAHHIVGNFVATELVYPTGDAASAPADLHPTQTADLPFLDALSVFYKFHFPDEFKKVEAAHSEGALFYSMETIPESVTCLAADCGKGFPYAGPQSPTYCGHLQETGAAKTLNKPHFLGGALILPPVRPGWRRADITQLSGLIKDHAAECERVYGEIATELPHLNPELWEQMMARVVGLAHEEQLVSYAKDFTDARRQKLAKQGKALADGSYPIESIADLKNAITLANSGHGDVAAAKAHIRKMAKQLGAETMIPPSWG